MGAIRPQPSTTRMLVGRNGRDGSSNASPDSLLRSLDPIGGRIGHQTGHNLGSYGFNFCAESRIRRSHHTESRQHA